MKNKTESRFLLDFFEFSFLVEACIPYNETFIFKDKKWKFFPLDNNYIVSTDGDVISLGRKVLRSNGNLQTILPKVLEPVLDKKGYKMIRLSNLGVVKSYKVHQLVAITFLGHIPCKMDRVVDHINNIKTDNRLENLQIISARENTTKDAKGGTSFYAGVCFSKEKQKWRSHIIEKGKKYHLGYFTSEEEASFYYQEALKCILEGREKDIKIKKRTKSSNYKGVTKTKRGKFRAAFNYKNKFYNAGSYLLEIDAHNAYLKLYNEVVYGKQI